MTTPPDNSEWIDELLSQAFNDFYDYITEKDIIKAAHEYSEKTIYKTAKAQIIAKLREARAQELEQFKEYAMQDMNYIYIDEEEAGTYVLNRIKALNSPQGEEAGTV